MFRILPTTPTVTTLMIPSTSIFQYFLGKSTDGMIYVRMNAHAKRARIYSLLTSGIGCRFTLWYKSYMEW